MNSLLERHRRVAILLVADSVTIVSVACVSGGASLDDLVGDWTNGAEVPRRYESVEVFRGAEHCGWEDVLFMSLQPEDGEWLQFVRAEAPTRLDWIAGPVEINVSLLSDAIDTGYERNGTRLFLAADSGYVWLMSDEATERWPRQLPQQGCD